MLPRRSDPIARAVPLALALGVALNALRMRRRLSRLRTLEPTGEAVDDRHRFVTAAGVELDPATRRAASAFASREGLEVVDLVPGDLPVDRARDIARMVDPETFRGDRLAPGRGALQALLVHEDVVERAGVTRLSGLDPVELTDLTARLKSHASASTDVVVAPALRAGPDELDKRMALLRRRHSGAPDWYAPTALRIAVREGSFAYGLLLASLLVKPRAGFAAGVLWSAQPYLVLAGRVPLAPRDLHAAALLRPVRDPLRWARTVAGRWRPAAEADPFEQRRALYAAELAAGTERFLEPRRDTCPWCGSRRVAERLTSPEMIQVKPGRFRLDRCADCGHMFQNPRLSPAGLEFYYRDFYDGLGERATEAVFASLARVYLRRAETLNGSRSPRHWLDVGAGHGHFCNLARDVWPETSFDGLDLAVGIEEAERRGWVVRAYRGLFPELARDLAGRYDVISMHHYLEHTREPLEELDAAANVLEDGGHLLIELPNPESRFGRILGSLWMPWFQPQHQHLVPLPNLLRALEDRGLHPVSVTCGEAHMPIDLSRAVFLLLNRVAPHPRRPWLSGEATRWRRIRFGAIWTAGQPLIVIAYVLDQLLAPLVRRTDGGNAYRVLARKNGAAAVRG